MRIIRRTDRYLLKLEKYMNAKGVVFELRPLTFEQKFEIQSCKKMVAGKEMIDGLKSTMLAVKYAVTGCKGIKTVDGDDYQLEFDDDGNLSDGCLDDLLNMEVGGIVANTCVGAINGYPDKIIDPISGEEMEGVKIKLGKL